MTDVAIVDFIGGTLYPSAGTLAIFHYHSAHTLSRDVALGILMTLLEEEEGDGVVVTLQVEALLNPVCLIRVGLVLS